jgi:hypothetical protein
MSYETEIILSLDAVVIVNKIRTLIGDEKQIVHDYIGTCKDRLSGDGCTIEMKNFGWPKSIYWNSIEETSSSGVIVHGYRYLTFSGTIAETDTIDMYYYSFRNSDTEIHDTYTRTIIPPGLTTTTVTIDHMIIQTAIDLLEAESWAAYNDEGVKLRDGDTQFDPSPGFVAREKAIARLYKRLDDLVTQYIMLGVEGTLID